MATSQETLLRIQNFEDLTGYLEKNLGWPLQEYGFDEITFEYTPAELGLRDADAVAIKAIHQLRPLAQGQPWGIFFVEFAKKKLPVVVLRRILSHLALKKRASANPSEHAAWASDDLLFVTAFGEAETDSREIAFAHFHTEPGDLPTLHVLGWDANDTVLKLANVDATLRAKLRWPENSNDPDAWRKSWSGIFRSRIGHNIKTAAELAKALAELAKKIRDASITILEHESDTGPLRTLHKGFRDALIHDLTEKDFADTYAQTITYGLFSAAVSRTDMEGGKHGTALTVSDIIAMVPSTNPFLKEMLETFLHAGGVKSGINFDELGLQEVVDLLRSDHTDLPAIINDFGNKTQGEDPVIHFYEQFLGAYNKELKVQRGVFYTPQPVVSYIVRSVHELLQTEFGLEDGLASTATWADMIKKRPELKLPPLTDTLGETRTIEASEYFVQILDPATGTATFPVEVIEVIHKHLKAKWDNPKGNRLADMPRLKNVLLKDVEKSFGDYWNAYVPVALLPRLHAYELMMAPYAIAHMKIGLKLAETGYRFTTTERARIYLTNALEPWVNQLPLIGFNALAHEADAVNEIKRHKRFTVVIGNPPYSGHSANNQLPWIVDKVHDYKRGLPDLQKPGQAKWLQDDYVKFLRLAEVMVTHSATGIVGMITNHSFLDNPTFRGLRRSLINSFTGLHFLDLHGNAKGREKNDAVSEDQNVFDIQQGVGISLLTVGVGESGAYYGELWGSRETKYNALQKSSIRNSSFVKIVPVPEYYLFIRQDAALRSEYEQGVSIHRAMGENGDPAPGIVTTQDEFAIAFTKSEMSDKVFTLVRTETETEARKLFRLCTQNQWNYDQAKRELRKGDWVNDIEPILYRPFDMRWTVFNQHVAVHRRLRVTRHLRAWGNLALVTTRSVEIGRGFEHVFCTRGLIQHHTVSLKEVNFVIPLYLRPDADELGFSKSNKINFSSKFLSRLSILLNIPQEINGIPKGLTPEDIFNYIYAIFHSPGYRHRYAEFLKIDFPRLPLTGNLELFRELARLGGELVSLHLVESPRQNTPISTYAGAARTVSKVGWTADHGGTVWINASGPKAETTAGTVGFQGVPEVVWNFHIGGYQVCEKWLKDRKGRTLTDDDIAHYHKIVVALSETIRLMAEIDTVIAAHGGWPGAFTAAPTA